MKKLIVFALSLISAFAIVLGFSLRDASFDKAYAASDYVAGKTPTIGRTMFKISSGGDALLLATSIEGVDDVYGVGYDITVSTGAVEPINTPTTNYYSSITLSGKTWTSSDIFGETYAEAKMIIWEIGYNSSYTYNIKAYANVGYRGPDDELYPAQGNEDFPDIKVEQESANKLSLNYTLTFKNGEVTVDTKEVTIGTAIGELPEGDEKLGYTFNGWTIGDSPITKETLYSSYADKTAVAAYVENPVHDNSACYSADFFQTSDDDYTLSATAVGADLDIGAVKAVHYNGSPLEYTTSAGNFVFDNDYVKGMPVGDYVIDVYTATDTYRAKVAIATKEITSVDDLNDIAAYGAANETAHTGYYILGADIDGGTVNVLSQYCGGNTYTTNGFRGIFDGRGHVIKNVTLADSRLFNGLGKGAIVRNLAFIDPVQTVTLTRSHVLACEVQNAAISNVLVKISSEKSEAKYAMAGIFNGSTIEKSVFIMEGGQSVFAQKDDNSGSAASSLTDIAIVVGDPTAGVLAEHGMAFDGLCAAAYKVEGEYDDYDDFKSKNNITEHASINEMLNALASDNFIDDLGSSLITYADKAICFNGAKVIRPVVALSAPSDIVYTGGTLTFEATYATFSMQEVAGASIDPTTGVLSVGADVAVDTPITVRATSTIDTNVYEELTVTVDYVPDDLTTNGVYDVELGQTFSVEGIDGYVIAIKTATGTKVALANANVITASELNTAAGKECGEDIEVTLYTATSSYLIRGNFITKIIKTVADLKAIAAYGTANRNTHTGYYILGNDIDGTGQDSVNALSNDSATHDNYTTQGFRGILDGRGHTLKNLRLQEGMLFWGIGNNGVVKNLALIDPVQVTSRSYALTRNITHGTISNVIVKAGCSNAIMYTDCGAIIENSVFILDTNGTNAIANKDDTYGGDIHTPTVLNNVVVVVKSNSGTLTALFGTDYKPSGETYAEYVEAHNIKDYASINAMLTALESEDFIAGWNAQITYDDGICLNGAVVIKPVIALTAPSNIVYAGDSMTLTATDATFSLKQAVAGASIDSDGKLTVGAGVAADTKITVRATSTIVPGVYEELTVTVDYEPEDLTAKVYDVELGQTFSVDGIDGNVIAIRGSAGKVNLATENVITADELNAAAGVKWSEGLTIKLYTASNAYDVKAAFITKLIHDYAEFSSVASGATTLDGYYVVANSFEANNSSAMMSWTTDTASLTTGFIGVLDGRNHVISNLKVNNYIINGIGKSTIKNIAFVNVTQTNPPTASGGKSHFLFGRSYGITMKNVFVSSTTSGTMCHIAEESPYFENVIYVTSDPDYGLIWSGSTGTLTIKNMISISGYANYPYYWFGSNKSLTNVVRYASETELLAALTATTFDGWNSPFAYSAGKLTFNEEIVSQFVLAVTGNKEVYANSSVTLTATDATFALKEEIAGVSIDATTGELTVGDVEIGTEIVVVATSTVVPAVSAEYTVTVVVKPVDLTANGVYDVELGSAHGIAAITDDILYIKTDTGSKIELANANIVTADELNTAAGVKWSENMAITFYSESKAYTLNAAFITKIIHNYAEYSAVASGAATLDGYYVIANSFEANNETPMASWTAYSSSTSTGFIGILDGRNHVISNLKVNNYILNGIGACTIKDIAFVNVTAANPSGGGKFLFNESHGMTMKNVFVSSSTAGTMCGFTGDAPNFENVVYVTTNLNGSQNYGLTWTGNTGTMKLKNVISVTPYSKGYYWGGNVSTDNLAVYASQSAMMSALTATTFDGWNSPFAFADGKLTFGGTVVLG